MHAQLTAQQTSSDRGKPAISGAVSAPMRKCAVLHLTMASGAPSAQWTHMLLTAVSAT